MARLNSAEIPKSRRAVFAVLSVTMGLGMGALLVEAGARLWFRDMPQSLASERQFFRASDDPLRVYEPVPNHLTPEGDRLNSLGLRGPETAVDKPAGVIRIAVIGDSFTYGQAVPEPATWVRRLEKLLEENADRRVDIEVLNFGVPGYNSKNELGTLGRALEFEPDLVLLAHLVYDDLWDIMRLSRGALLFHTEADLESRIPLPRSAQRKLYRWSLFYRLATTQYLRATQDQHRAEAHGGEASPDAMRGWEADDDGIDAPSLRQFFQQCAERRVDVVLLQFPMTLAEVQTERTPAEAKVTQSLRDLTSELGVPMLDLFPLLLGVDGTSLQVAHGDVHPNAELHGRYARHTADWLTENYVGISDYEGTASLSEQSPTPLARRE